MKSPPTSLASNTSIADIDDPINSAILSVSEDRVQGFHEDPFGEISNQCGIAVETVMLRIRVMMAEGTIRRVRQTLMATSLAQGCLAAWKVPAEFLNSAFDYMYNSDPFSGHVVIRSTEPNVSGSEYRLWTTLKIPQGYSLDKHAKFLARKTGAEAYKLMPAKRLFVLGVGHIRRKGIPIGSMSDSPAEEHETKTVVLDPLDWKVLTALKRDLKLDEVCRNIWQHRAEEAGISTSEFCQVARSLNERRVIGRFSTFLEHVKPIVGDKRVTRYNALFHWAVPEGKELQAGREVGRFHIMTHAYWREGGPEFRNVNIMGVAHSQDKDVLLAHKNAIDIHLQREGIEAGYTNVFWGGRSEIKPSEIVPNAYRQFCIDNGILPTDMIQ